ncbi:MAG: ATP synthase subunit I, partial [Pseudomonadota bacterium]
MNTASKIIGLQLGVTVFLALVAWGWLGVSDARSVLLGGMICLLPNAFLATRLFVAGKSGDARRVLRAAWVGEIGKLLLTAVMFAWVFVNVQPLNAGLLFGAFIAAQSVVLVGLL